MDLYFVLAYTFGVGTIALTLNMNGFAVVLPVLLSPGYVLVSALFPTNEGIDWFERLALTLCLSIAVVLALGYVMSLTPWGIRAWSTGLAIVAFTACVGLAAYWRRTRLPPNQRLAGSFTLSRTDWKGRRGWDRMLTGVLGASIIVAVALIGYVMLDRSVRVESTEFFLLGPGGNATGYPTNLTASQPGMVVIGVVNHETVTVDYTVQVELIGLNIVYNSSCTCNMSIEVNHTNLSWINQTLQDSASWMHPYSFTIGAPGMWKVRFVLFKNHAMSMQAVQLFVHVS